MVWLYFLSVRADTGAPVDTADCQDWRPDYEYVDGQCVDTDWEPVNQEGRDLDTDLGSGAFDRREGLVRCAPGSDTTYVYWGYQSDSSFFRWLDQDGVMLGFPITIDDFETCCDGHTGVPKASIGIPTPRCLAPVPVRDPELLLYGECNPDPESSGCATVSSPAVGGAVMSLGLLVLLGWRRE